MEKKMDFFQADQSNSLEPQALGDGGQSAILSRPAMPGPMEQLKSAWGIFSKNWQSLVLLTLIPMIFTAIGGIFAFLMKWIVYVPMDQLDPSKKELVFNILGLNFSVTETVSSNVWLFVALFLVSFVVMFLVTISTTVAQFIVLKDNNPKQGLGESIKKSLPYLGNYFIFSVAYVLLLMIGFILLVIPGIIFMIWFSFGYLAIIFDDAGSIESFKKSRSLVKGYWWAVAGRLSFWILVSFIVTMAVAIAGLLVGGELAAILSNLIALIIGPVGYAYYAVVYQDLKKIKNA